MATQVSVTPPASNVFLQEIVPFTFNGNLDLLMLWSLAQGGSSVPLQVLQYNPSTNRFFDATSGIFAGAIPAANNPRNVTVADFNHDGNPDIVIANQGLDQWPWSGTTDTFLLSTPSGKLTNASGNLPQTLAYSHDVSSGIVDSAGDEGVFVNNIYSQAGTAPYYLISNGDGTFRNVSASDLPAGLQSTYPAYTGSALADLNGDGVADLVVGAEDLTHGPSEVYLNPGNGDFAAATPIALPAPPLPATTGLYSSIPSGPTVLDIEPIHISSSAYNDLVVVSTTGDYEGFAIQILINDGHGHFTDETASRLLGASSAGVFPAGSGLGGITWDIHAFVDDLNGNGPDIITEGRALPSQVFLNDGAGHFNLAYSLPYTNGWQIDAVATIAGTPTLIESNFTSVQLVPYQPPPEIVNPIANQTALEGQPFSYTVPAYTFADPSGQALTYTASGPNGSALPAWLSFNPSTMTLSGTAPAARQTYSVTITATDTSGWLAEDNFSISVGRGRSRFNAGGSSPDILWQNAGGQAAVWDMSGTSIAGGGTVSANPGPSWEAIGTGDFNDDGHPDILWQNANGQAAVWEMNGSTLIGGGTVSANPGPSWQAVGTGDFNHDGHADILWQNADGQAAVWEMSGSTLVGGGTVSANPGPSWKAIGTGDFNGDGKSDIVWQNANGQVAIWEMNGNAIVGGGTVAANPGPSWKVVGTGDFNDDGRSDILFQNLDGQLAIWEMNGTSIIGGGTIPSDPGPNWQAVGTGDFNSDGHSDILFQNVNGQSAIWEMNGAKIVGGGSAGPNPGPSWSAI